MTPSILLFGAGKSATVLIEYLLQHAEKDNYRVVLVDANESAARQKVGNNPGGAVNCFDIRDEQLRKKAIQAATLVISLLPPALHELIANDCLLLGKNLLTASYVDDKMRALSVAAANKNLLFLCEMGLDPGIDHMSAKKIIDDIHARGGQIKSFYSHCGGLVAPGSDDNPWHYKISWNPRNVVNAGKAGAIYLKNGVPEEKEYEQLFREKHLVSVPGGPLLAWYPNRDSLSYRSVYGLDSCHTLVRTTLRHPDFMYGWSNLIELALTSEQPLYETAGKSLSESLWAHLRSVNFEEWIQERLSSSISSTNSLMAELVQLNELEKKAGEKGIPLSEELMLVDQEGDLQNIEIDELKINAASALAEKMHEAAITLKQLFHLGLSGSDLIITRAQSTPADLLQIALESHLALKSGDRDLVVMLHEFEYELQGSVFKTTATLYLEGEDDHRTAMAKTVGLPLGIAARMMLKKAFRLTGVQIPIDETVYEPVLAQLTEMGIRFSEHTEKVSR